MADAAALSCFKPYACRLPGPRDCTHACMHARKMMAACSIARIRFHTLAGDSEHVHGLLSIGPGLKLPHVKFIYPQAPEIPITLFGGAVRHAWFDMAHPGKPMQHVIMF